MELYEGLEPTCISTELLSIYRGMIGRFRSSRQTGPLGQQVRSIRFSGSRVRIISDRFAYKVVPRCAPEREPVYRIQYFHAIKETFRKVNYLQVIQMRSDV